jgi:hypothetical protein
MNRTVIAAALAALLPSLAITAAQAQSNTGLAALGERLHELPFEVGIALDAGYTTRALALGMRRKGLGLGPSELSVAGELGQHFTAGLTLGAHSERGDAHDDDGEHADHGARGHRFELEVEEAFVETTSLPGGLTVRGGRFLSQVGVLNPTHMHEDDFVERPLLYRAFLGNHWFDDGVRLGWTAPTSLGVRWTGGVEVLRGRQLAPDATHGEEDGHRAPDVGAITVGTRIAADIGRNVSWQAGASLLRNRLSGGHDDDVEDGDHASHAHGARYTGRDLMVADLAWHWAPDGKPRSRQLRLAAEHARLARLGGDHAASDRHQGTYLSAVYRFAPQWEAGIRHDDLRIAAHPDEGAAAQRLAETAVAIAWRATDASTLRLQWTGQRDRGGFDEAARSVQLQYVFNFGAHRH